MGEKTETGNEYLLQAQNLMACWGVTFVDYEGRAPTPETLMPPSHAIVCVRNSLIRNWPLRLGLPLALLLITIFGGFLIQAIDPFFGFRWFSEGSEGYVVRTIDLTKMHLAVDGAHYGIVSGDREGAYLSFSRNGQYTGSLGGRDTFYAAIIHLGNSGPPVILAYAPESEHNDTGVWRIDETAARDIANAPEYRWRGNNIHGALRRVPTNLLSGLIIRFAAYLSLSPLWTVALTLVFFFQLAGCIRSLHGRVS